MRDTHSNQSSRVRPHGTRVRDVWVRACACASEPVSACLRACAPGYRARSLSSRCREVPTLRGSVAVPVLVRYHSGSVPH
jgi:hypothetical protein